MCRPASPPGTPAATAWPPPPPASPTAIVQGNLAILPEKLAAAFHRFCQLNPKPCPIIGMSDVGDFRIPALGLDLDIRTDLPRYRVWRDGEVVDEPTDITAYWRDDLVAFVIGCSYSFEEALLADGLPIRHIERNAARADVPHQYRLQRRRARSPVRWWCRCGRSSRRMRSARCRSPRAFPPCMARRFISAIRIRSASPIIAQARLRRCGAGRAPTRFRCSGPAASPRKRSSRRQRFRSRSRMRPAQMLVTDLREQATRRALRGSACRFIEALPSLVNRFIGSMPFNRGICHDDHSPQCVAWCHRHRRADADRGPRADRRSGDRRDLSDVGRQCADRRRRAARLRDRGRDHQQRL